MNNKVDINEIYGIKEKLHSLKDNEAVLIEEEGITKYAVIPIETYEFIEELNNMTMPQPNSKIVVAGDIQELSYEEYEKIKAAVLETLEMQLKPKAEKLN